MVNLRTSGEGGDGANGGNKDSSREFHFVDFIFCFELLSKTNCEYFTEESCCRQYSVVVVSYRNSDLRYGLEVRSTIRNTCW